MSIFSPKLTHTSSSLGQTFMEEKARIGSSALTSGVKSEAVENERTCKTSFVQAGSAPSAVQLREHLCRLPGPVPPVLAPWCPWTGADSRHAALSRSSPSSLQISAARLCFYTLCNVLQGARRLSRMGFSLFPCWGCQFSTLYQCCFVPGPRFGAGQIIQLWRNPECSQRAEHAQVDIPQHAGMHIDARCLAGVRTRHKCSLFAQAWTGLS